MVSTAWWRGSLVVALLWPALATAAWGQQQASPKPETVEQVEKEAARDVPRVPYQALEVTTVHHVGAALLNIVYVPGKVITCGAGTGVAALTMLATLGSQYSWAVRFFKEGCDHPWYLKPEYVAGKDPKDE